MSLTRRLFLNRIGVTTAAATAVALPPAACTIMSEDPELVGLGKKMDEAEARYLALDDNWKDARARAVAAMPAVPSGLFVRADERPMHRSTELECLRDFDGNALFNGPSSDMKLSRTSLINRVGAFDALPDDHWAKNSELHQRARELLALDEKYEDERERARDRSGFNDADNARYKAERAILDIAALILAIDPRTSRGLLTQAKAMTAAAGLSRSDASAMAKRFALNAERILSDAAV